MRNLFALSALALLVFCLAFPVVSDGQDGEEEICACYQKEHGQLRIVSDPSKCLPSEVPIFLSGRRASIEIPSLLGTWTVKDEYVTNEASFSDPENHFPWVSPGGEIKITAEKILPELPHVRFLKGQIPWLDSPYWGDQPPGDPPIFEFAAILIKNQIHITAGGTIMHATYVPGDTPKFEGCNHHVYEHEGADDDAYNPQTSHFVMEKVE